MRSASLTWEAARVKRNTSQGNNEKNLRNFSDQYLFPTKASWHGSIVWDEHNRIANFRSVLELMMLMDSTICGGERQDNEPTDSSETSQKSGTKGNGFFEKDD